MKPLRIGLAIALPLALVAGCKVAPMALPSTSLAEVVALGVLEEARLAGSTPKDGLANLRVTMNVRDTSGYRLQALPGAWSEAVVSLHSASVNTAYDADDHTRRLSFDAFGVETLPGNITSLHTDNAIAVALGLDGDIFFADHDSRRILKRDKHGVVTIFAGPGTVGTWGDGGEATDAYMPNPRALAVDAAGNVYIASADSGRVRKVDTNGIITTVAGPGTAGMPGDGGPAKDAYLSTPYGVAVDAAGNLYIAERDGRRIRKVDTNGVITTVAGPGTAGVLGDGGPAQDAYLSTPYAVAVDAAGNLYIADDGDDRIRKVDTTGIITTIAGTGAQGVSGDGGAATASKLYDPRGLAVDARGNVYFAEYLNEKIRKVDAFTGRLTTMAGTGAFASTGDGGPATSATLMHPTGVAVDAAGHLYIAEPNAYKLRKVTNTPNYVANVAFPPLRPAADYEARVYLKNEAGAVTTLRLAGSHVGRGIALKAGPNALTFDVTVNGEEASYSVSESASGNRVDGNAITKDDVVTLKTGLMAKQPGVARLAVSLAGEAYETGGPVLIGRLEAAASATWDTFEWDTTATQEQYVPSRLRGGAELASRSGRLLFEAFNDREEPVGSTVLPIEVYGRPQVQIRLR